MTKKAFLVSVGLGLALALSTASFAQEERPSEGVITRIDADAKMITIKDEVGDEWDLYWTETTAADGLPILELRPGEFVQFEYEMLDGRKVLLEIRRSSKARWLKFVEDIGQLV